MTQERAWTIIGAGMGGMGLAAQLGVDGLRLRLHDIDEARVAGVRAAGGIHVEGRDRSFAPIEMATTDLAEAVAGAHVLLVSVHGNDHPKLATQLAPHLEDGQTIVLIQGHFAGVLVFKKALERAGCRAQVDVAEMDSYPYMLTVKSADTVLLTTTKQRWSLVASPSSRTEVVLAKIRFAFPGLEPATSLLAKSFSGNGGIFHAAGMVTNVGNVEGPDAYNFYAANMVPSVCNLIEKMAAEREAVAAAYGARAIDMKKWLADAYGYKDMTLSQALQKMAVNDYRYAPAPKSMRHRYLVQDIGCEVVPMVALGQAAGVKTPASSAVVDIANALTQRDFWVEGRNLSSLGVQGMQVAQIKEFFGS